MLDLALLSHSVTPLIQIITFPQNQNQKFIRQAYVQARAPTIAICNYYRWSYV